MAKRQPKTLAPLLILRILEEYSDERHPLTKDEITRLLDEKYGITMERKAFFRHMRTLQGLTDEGIYIRRITLKSNDPDEGSCAGFYMTDRTFSEQDLRVIIDALSGSQYLSQWETEDIVKRLASLRGRHFQSKMKAYQFIGRATKTDNETLMFNLEIIDEAITENKQIRFDMVFIGNDGKLDMSRGYSEVCTPIRCFVQQRHYYLVGVKTVDEKLRQMGVPIPEGGLQLVAYPLSEVVNMEKLELPAQDYRSLPEFKHGMDWQKFLREHPVMSWLQGKPELCTFLCFRWMIDDIISQFGDELRIRQLTDEEFENASKAIVRKAERDWLVEVSVVTDPYAAAKFARSCELDIWLIAPKDARGAVRMYAGAQLDHYERLEQYYIKGKKLPPIRLSSASIRHREE